MAGHRLIYLFVDDARTDQEVFRSGNRTITARDRSRYTKLEIPLSAGQRCYEPADIQATASGVSVQFSCSTKSGAATGEPAQQETPDPALRQEPQAPKSTRSEELLKAALALPADMAFARAEDDQEEPAAKPETEQPQARPSEAVAAAKVKAPTATPALAATKQVAAPAREPAAPVKASPAPQEAAPQPAPSPAPTSFPQGPALAGTAGGSSWFVLGVLLLVGAIGGLVVFTRKRAQRTGLIRILETAAIGPKRTLLVARVNGRTMVLGASEAGIALLETIDGRQPAPVAQVMGEPPPVLDRSEEAVDVPMRRTRPVEAATENEGGVLSRLFHRRPKLVSDADEAAFRELLSESYEDQELRERLSQGLVAKVS
jgi:flagellar biogenesis protein FliO